MISTRIQTNLLSLFILTILNFVAFCGDENQKKYLGIRANHDQKIFHSREEAIYFQCLSNFKANPKNWFFLERETEDDSLQTPSYCFIQERLEFDWFYAIRLADSVNEISKFQCNMKENFWECQSSTLGLMPILSCSSLPMSESDTFIISDQSREIIAYCASLAEFKISAGTTPYLKAFYHPLYPIVKEYIIPKGQSFDLNFGASGYLKAVPSCLGVTQKDSLHFEQCDKEKCRGSTVQNFTLLESEIDKMHVGIEYFSKKSQPELSLMFSVPTVVIDEDLLAFFMNINQTLFIIGRGLSSNCSYSLVFLENNSRIPCRYHSQYMMSSLQILKCELKKKSFLMNWELEIRNSSFIRQSSIQKETIMERGKSFAVDLPFKYHSLEANYLEIFGIEKILGQWLFASGKQEPIINCDFFTGQSTLGELISARRILCPIPDASMLLPSTSLHMNMNINDTLIDVSIAFGDSDQISPSYSTYLRLLQSQSSPYALSPLYPVIITKPAEEEDVFFGFIESNFLM